MIRKYFSGLRFGKRELLVFSCGLVTATLLFMTFVAVLGTILSSFISTGTANILNVCVGALIVFFGLKMLLKKPS